jgi:hypothetical protein
MKITVVAIAFLLASVAHGPTALGAKATAKEPLDMRSRDEVKQRFHRLMELANSRDVQAIHDMFWQSPSALLVAKSAVPAEGNWSGFWGNDAIDQKLHDIAQSGPVVIEPDDAKLKVVGLTREVAESYAPLNITVSYAGQDGTPKPFLIIIDWLKTGGEWKIASEVLLPVPPAPAIKN